MCGIAGKVYADPRHPVEQGVVQAMCDAMIHRGPDDGGVHLGGRVGLGMRRLQVIDLPGGHQPMANEDGTVWVVFNGEIYNFVELRQRLQQAGHTFRTVSDTEVILHLYEEAGDECVRDLLGMFAFALWDERRERLLLVRDRLGKKPLYYAQLEGGVVFASELGALMRDSSISREVDPRTIDEYLSCLFVPHPRTMYRQARKLPPGSRAVYQHGRLAVERYWTVDYSRPADRRLEENAERLDDLLRQAVETRMVADVPVGAFLSGGLDSSLVVALMQRCASQPVRTFSIGFEEASFSELEPARQVARILGTDHHEHVVRYDVQDLLPHLVAHFGEPFADSSAIPTFHLSRVARQEVTVALSGDGGDEVFGGYRRYQARLLVDAYNRWPALLGRGMVDRLIRQMHEPTTYYGASVRKKARRFQEFAAAVRGEPRTSWAFFFTEAEKASLYTPEFAATLKGGAEADSLAPYLEQQAHCPGQEMLWLDLMTYLPDDILVKVDRMSMACSLETRTPLLDHRVVELMARVPRRQKVGLGSTKRLLRVVASRYLPSWVLRRPKQGFAVPLASWLQGELRGWMEGMLLGPALAQRGHFRPAEVERMVRAHLSGQRDYSQQLWALMVLEAWLQEGGGRAHAA